MAPLCRLYLITPPRLDDLAGFGHALVDALAPIAQARSVAVILNDDPALAAKLDCDGVHVGQDDAPLAEARRLMGRDRIVGVTCHDSLHLAMEAAEGGADYVAFGAFFPTQTKAAKTHAELDLLRGWQADMLTPCVAIGGITVATGREVAAAGADFVAVSAGVWSHADGPAAAVAAFNAEIALGVADRGD